MRDHCFNAIEYDELIGKTNEQYSNIGRATHPKAAKKEAGKAEAHPSWEKSLLPCLLSSPDHNGVTLPFALSYRYSEAVQASS